MIHTQIYIYTRILSVLSIYPCFRDLGSLGGHRVPSYITGLECLRATLGQAAFGQNPTFTRPFFSSRGMEMLGLCFRDGRPYKQISELRYDIIYYENLGHMYYSPTWNRWFTMIDVERMENYVYQNGAPESNPLCGPVSAPILREP